MAVHITCKFTVQTQARAERDLLPPVSTPIVYTFEHSRAPGEPGRRPLCDRCNWPRWPHGSGRWCPIAGRGRWRNPQSSDIYIMTALL